MQKTINFDTFLGEAIKYNQKDASDEVINKDAERRMNNTINSLINQGYTKVYEYMHEAVGQTIVFETPATLSFDMSIVPEIYLEELIAKLHQEYRWNALGGRAESEAKYKLLEDLKTWSQAQIKEAKLLGARHTNTSYSAWEYNYWMPDEHHNLSLNFWYTFPQGGYDGYTFKEPADFTFYVIDFRLRWKKDAEGKTDEKASSVVGTYKSIPEMVTDLIAKGYKMPFVGPQLETIQTN